MKGTRRNLRDILRGTLPTNKQPLFVRVLANEVPQDVEFNDPHSPIANMSPSVLPHNLRMYRNKRKDLSLSDYKKATMASSSQTPSGVKLS